MNIRLIITVLILMVSITSLSAQEHSVARKWNELLLTAIRNDFARPTVHARNLFHISAAMYDAWSAFDPSHGTWLIGNTRGTYTSDFSGFPATGIDPSDREKAISYAAYRLILHRFEFSPGALLIRNEVFDLMLDLGYDPLVTGTDYTSGDPAQLGNYIAREYILFGSTDGSNESTDYVNEYYSPINPPLVPVRPGNPQLINPNRWQPLFLDTFIDQSGNPIPVGQISFLSPEWGNVVPFSLGTSDRKYNERDGNTYWTYVDPGPPPYIQEDGEGQSDAYKWGFTLVSVWGSHLDPEDDQLWDISPASLGNLSELPSSIEAYEEMYNLLDGGDGSTGHDINPQTGLPYEPNLVKRGDYTRVLAEFWADGPDSETPPGHWFTILNYVNDQPELERRFGGEGPLMDQLEWDIKSYLTLGGAMHDAAISAWSVKGWYDYIRPISAIRYMADMGQSTDPEDMSYHPAGIPLIEGRVELIRENDPLAGPENMHVGKIKVYSWRGPDYINDPETEYAGVGWIRAENWWPYQRPTFVTPPFAGYVSGHSTFSRAAAEVLTRMTGDPYFPGGMGEFIARKNEFLVFEEGPSEDVRLQWATYRDASDQTSLSRIWGGIHPPADDIPGRRMGIRIGNLAYSFASRIFSNAIITSNHQPFDSSIRLSPNPVATDGRLIIHSPDVVSEVTLFDLSGKLIQNWDGANNIQLKAVSPGIYILQIHDLAGNEFSQRLIVN